MKNILLIDDTIILSKNLNRHLPADDFSITECSNAIYAIETIEKQTEIDLLLINPAMTLHRENRDNTQPVLEFIHKTISPQKVRLLVPAQATGLVENNYNFEVWPKDEIVFERVHAYFSAH